MLSQQRLNGTHVPWNNVTGLRSGNKVESKWESDFLSSSIRSLFLASSSNSTPFYRTRQRRHDYSSLSLRRVQDEREREKDARKLDRICGRGESGARAVFRQQLLPLPLLFIHSISNLPHACLRKLVHVLNPFSLPVLSPFPSSWNLVVGRFSLERCSPLWEREGKGRVEKEVCLWRNVLCTLAIREARKGIRSFFSFIYFFFFDR